MEFLDDGKFHLHQRLNFSGFFFLFLDFSLRNFDFAWFIGAVDLTKIVSPL